jgi:hypothetical protein
MALPHPKQHLKAKMIRPEEIKVREVNHSENALFAMLGAVSALIVGLTLFGDLQFKASDRQPASSATTGQIETHEETPLDEQFKPYGY